MPKHCGDGHHQPPPHVSAWNLIGRVPKNAGHHAREQYRRSALDRIKQIHQHAPFPSERPGNIGGANVSTANRAQVHAVHARHDRSKWNASAPESDECCDRPVRWGERVDRRECISEHGRDARQLPSGCLHWLPALALAFGHHRTLYRWREQPR